MGWIEYEVARDGRVGGCVGVVVVHYAAGFGEVVLEVAQVGGWG